jgi:hypothetical protein
MNDMRDTRLFIKLQDITSQKTVLVILIFTAVTTSELRSLQGVLNFVFYLKIPEEFPSDQ